MFDSMTTMILWVLAVAVVYLAAHNHIENFFSLNNKSGFEWWFMWGLRFALLFLPFYIFFRNFFDSVRLGVMDARDITILVFFAFIVAFLFGLLTGHTGLLLHRAMDRKFLKEIARARRPSAASVVPGLNISFTKIIVFAVLGALILLWLLDLIIVRLK